MFYLNVSPSLYDSTVTELDILIQLVLFFISEFSGLSIMYAFFASELDIYNLQFVKRLDCKKHDTFNSGNIFI